MDAEPRGESRTDAVADLAGLLRGKRVALVHDSLTQLGGAERVLQVFHEMLPAAPIYTTVVNRTILPSGLRGADIRSTWLQAIPLRHRVLPIQAVLSPRAAESFDLRGYDLVISSSSTVAHGARVPDGIHISYVYNTMRYAWDYDTYMADYPLPKSVKRLGRGLATQLARWDRRVGGRAQKIVPISRTVAERVRRRWLLNPCDPVSPPADVPGYDIGTLPKTFYLVISRLQPYKRIEVAIQAANLLRAPLLVAGEGPDRPRLERLAGPTVRLLGSVLESEKAALFAGAWAVVVPGAEDYGLVPIEANGHGTPVVAWDRGGVAETQVDGLTAVMVPESSPSAFAAAMESARGREWDRRAIRAQALTRDRSAFEQRFRDLIGRAFSSQLP